MGAQSFVGDPYSLLWCSLEQCSSASLYETRLFFVNLYVLEHMSLQNFVCNKTWGLLHKFRLGLNRILGSIPRTFLLFQSHHLSQKLQWDHPSEKPHCSFIPLCLLKPFVFLTYAPWYHNFFTVFQPRSAIITLCQGACVASMLLSPLVAKFTNICTIHFGNLQS